MSINSLLQVMIDGILLGAVYAALGVSLTLVFGVLRIVTFCHGDFVMIALYGLLICSAKFGLDPYVSAPFVFFCMFGLAAALYKALIEPVMKADEHSQIVTTLALGLILQNLALLFFSADVQTIPSFISGSVVRMGSVVVRVPSVTAAILAVLVCMILAYVLNRTALGRRVRATAQDRDAAALCGVEVGRIYLVAFCVGIGILGIVAALLAPTFYVSPSVGNSLSLTAFIIVVLGGLGNFSGAIVAGFIIGSLEAVGGLLTSGSMSFALTYGLFVIILLFRPQGLFGVARL